MRWLPLVLFLGLASCALPPNPPRLDRAYLNPKARIQVDGNTCSASDTEILQTAVDSWRLRTDGFVSLRFTPSTGMVIQCVDLEPDTYGRTQNWPHLRIWVDPGRTGPAALRTAIHEFGHAFGLRHSKNPDCVMYTPNTGRPLICSEDVELLCEIWGC